MLLAVIEGASRVSSCVSAGSERIMHVSVSNQANNQVGPLREFRLGFVVRARFAASAKTGWTTKIEGDERHSVILVVARRPRRSLGFQAGARTVDLPFASGRVGSARARIRRGGRFDNLALFTTHDCSGAFGP